MKLAERSGFGGNRLKFLAMGQGQGKVSKGEGIRKEWDRRVERDSSGEWKG